LRVVLHVSANAHADAAESSMALRDTFVPAATLSTRRRMSACVVSLERRRRCAPSASVTAISCAIRTVELHVHDPDEETVLAGSSGATAYAVPPIDTESTSTSRGTMPMKCARSQRTAARRWAVTMRTGTVTVMNRDGGEGGT
jgi:hypothetical protein